MSWSLDVVFAVVEIERVNTAFKCHRDLCRIMIDQKRSSNDHQTINDPHEVIHFRYVQSCIEFFYLPRTKLNSSYVFKKISASSPHHLSRIETLNSFFKYYESVYNHLYL